MAPRELDDRQEHLHRVDTMRGDPLWIEPSRTRRKTRWQRFVARLKMLLRRRR